ncbi:ABC transporter ATP-binding protein [Peterkaempfera bronchialis]|uniref:ABC transporter ATP-binding protein n=1 Tax=Peterkaempfera bronchialis TaxID=2126346 RepID=UPI003C2CBBBE
MLNVESLVVRYGTAHALSGISLTVEPGRVTALLGNNGAGKTTLLRTLSGTIALHGGLAVGGSAQLEGRDLLRTPADRIVRAGLAQVPEGRRVFAQLSVEDNLRAGGLSVKSRRDAEQVLGRVLEMFPILRERSRQSAGLLSGGEQQMLAIGRALMSSPRVLLLDEPSLGIAPLVAREIATAVRQIADTGVAVLLVEQNTRLALGIADQVYAVDGGAVAAQGPASEFADSELLRRLSLGGGSGGAPASPRPASPRPVSPRPASPRKEQ